MATTGNFKKRKLIAAIVIVYSLTQFAIIELFQLLKIILDINYQALENWQFYLSKVIPISIVSFFLNYAENLFNKLPNILQTKIYSLLFQIPIIKGTYTGVIRQQNGNTYNVNVKISQTLSNTDFQLISSGGSTSTSECVVYEKRGFNWNVYIYYENFNPKIPNDVKDYSGACKLTYFTKEKELVGLFFTSQQVVGTLEITKDN